MRGSSQHSQRRRHAFRISLAAFSHRSSLQAQQCMNLPGASRRSAAPGNQFVGLAGYGDNSSRHVRPPNTKTAHVCALSAQRASCLQARAFHLSVHHRTMVRVV